MNNFFIWLITVSCIVIFMVLISLGLLVILGAVLGIGIWLIISPFTHLAANEVFGMGVGTAILLLVHTGLNNIKYQRKEK